MTAPKEIGIKSGVLEFNKYEVDVLGKYYKVKVGDRSWALEV